MNKRLHHAAQVVLTEPVEAEGTEIELHGTVRAPMRGLQVYGKSAQRTTKGTNLCDFRNYPTKTQNGVTITADEYGVITVSGTPTLESGYAFTYMSDGLDLSLFEVGKTYYTNYGMQLEYGDVTKYYAIFVFDETIKKIRPYVQRSVSRYVDGEVFKVVVSEGSLAEWEPFTGGNPSPSPEYPQEIVSVGDARSIEVNISGNRGQDIQSAVLETPNGLPGIPVSSGGNYTDADGQQWVCDEVDFERGVYVQRVGNFLYGGETISKGKQGGYDRYSVKSELSNAKPGKHNGYCNIFKYAYTPIVSNNENNNITAHKSGSIFFRCDQISTVEECKEMLQEKNMRILYELGAPIEKPLSAAELAAYKVLRSKYPTTIITNSEDTHMKVNCLKICGGGYKLLSLLLGLQRRWCYA